MENNHFNISDGVNISIDSDEANITSSFFSSSNSSNYLKSSSERSNSSNYIKSSRERSNSSNSIKSCRERSNNREYIISSSEISKKEERILITPLPTTNFRENTNPSNRLQNNEGQVNIPRENNFFQSVPPRSNPEDQYIYNIIEEGKNFENNSHLENLPNEDSKSIQNLENEELTPMLPYDFNNSKIKNDFSTNFQNFSFKLSFSEKICCSKKTDLFRLKKLKNHEFGNQGYKKELKNFIINKIIVEANLVEDLSIVDLYLISFLLEANIIEGSFNEIANLVNGITNQSIKVLNNETFTIDTYFTKIGSLLRKEISNKVLLSDINIVELLKNL